MPDAPLRFWLLAASVAMLSALGTGLIVHHFDVMASRGIERAAAAAVFTPFALVIATTNLGAGALIDRLDARVPVVAMLVLQASCLAAAGPVLLALGAPLLGGNGPVLWAPTPLPLALAAAVALGSRTPRTAAAG